MMTLYARKVPATGNGLAKPPKGAFDVAIYQDKACTRPAMFFYWPSRLRPDNRNRSQMWNCSRYALQWLPDFTLADYPRLVAKTARAEYYETRPGLFNTRPQSDASGYYSLSALMKLKGDYVMADYGRESL
jgi:hypothetical protein